VATRIEPTQTLAGTVRPTAPGKRRPLWRRLYAGQVDYDFISRKRRWYAVSGVFLVVSVVALVARGLNLGIDFKGGSTYEVPRGTGSVAVAEEVLRGQGVADPTVQQLSGSGAERLRIVTPVQTAEQSDATIAALAKRLGVPVSEVTASTVGPTWGSQISRKALQGLVIFLVVVSLYLAFRFEPRMALAALLALVHDLLITIGIYVLVGFEVTPATVIAVLTILGFSLYDTVIVFDRVRELTRGLSATSKTTYGEAANRSLNQTVVRSLNTSLIAALPVASLLVIGAGLLGAGTLKDLALAQFVGILAGAYSSIFIATPLLVQLKGRDPAVRTRDERVLRAREQQARRGSRQIAAASDVAARAGGALPDPGAGVGTDIDQAEAGTEGGTEGGAEHPAGYARVGAPVGAGVGSRRVDPARPARRKSGKGGRPSGKRRR